MATLGLLSTEFPADALGDNLRAMASTGAVDVQFDLVNAADVTFPAQLSDTEVAAIRAGFIQHGLTMAALSGTYNMIDPDPAKRATGAADLDRLIGWAPRLGVRVVTLCTGSRDPRNMWRRHADSDTPEAWRDLLASVERAVTTAERNSVFLGVETEVGNCVNTVQRARRLLDEIRSPSLAIIMDGANIFQDGDLPRMREKLDEAFDLLGPDIVLAHAKDLDRDGEAGQLPAGMGKLDYPYYLAKLKEARYDGAIILHALRPAQAAACLQFVNDAAPRGYLPRS